MFFNGIDYVFLTFAHLHNKALCFWLFRTTIIYYLCNYNTLNVNFQGVFEIVF